DRRVLTVRVVWGSIAVHAVSDKDESAIGNYAQKFTRELLRASEFHPDAWPVIIVRNPAETQARLTAVAGNKYSYHELDDFTDLIARSLKTLPIVSKVTPSGVLDQRVYLEASQERLAADRSKGRPP